MDHDVDDSAVRALTGVFLLVVCGPAGAHTGWVADGNGQAFIVVAMLTAGALYASGLVQLWRAAGRGRGVTRGEAWCYASGWAALAVALLSPLDAMGERLFAAHMVQHELLMLLAAPLLVIGRPLATWSWALPARMRYAATRALANPAWAAAWHAITRPLAAWLLHAAAVWGWHAPALFNAARAGPWMHILQHASFLGTALLFWWSLLRPHPRRAMPGGALIYLFTTMVHTGLLGGLFVFSRTVWYPENSTGAAQWGWTALEDQQLGGLIMWIPGGLVYLAVALLLLARVLSPPGGKAAYR